MTGRRIAGWVIAFVSIGLSAVAQTSRIETVRWTDQLNAAGSVSKYRVRFGGASGSYTHAIDVGIPSLVSGAFQSQVTIPSTLPGNVYMVVSAVRSTGVEGFFSNEICRNGGIRCGTSGGGSTPPPTTAQSAVTGFALWNAQTDTLVDSSFQSGEAISLASGNCVAIQIKTNPYLEANGAGSVKTVFDGQDTGCSEAGVTHENSAPYSWEEDEGPGVYSCAQSLTVAGRHTLKATPYDGENCSGAVGTAVTLTFDVMPGTTGGTATIGQPGRPFLVD